MEGLDTLVGVSNPMSATPSQVRAVLRRSAVGVRTAGGRCGLPVDGDRAEYLAGQLCRLPCRESLDGVHREARLGAVMDELAEELPAEVVVLPREEDEVVPAGVDAVSRSDGLLRVGTEPEEALGVLEEQPRLFGGHPLLLHEPMNQLGVFVGHDLGERSPRPDDIGVRGAVGTLARVVVDALLGVHHPAILHGNGVVGPRNAGNRPLLADETHCPPRMYLKNLDYPSLL